MLLSRGRCFNYEFINGHICLRALRLSVCPLLCLLCLILPAFVVAEPLIFSTSNASPFSSEHNPQAGYVNEIIRRAFASKSISTRFEHYPHTRAVFMATQGKTAGVFPLRSNQAHKDSLYYSNPIPGTKIGYLVPAATQVDTILPVKNGDINAHFLRLGLTRIGYITGAPIPQALVDASNIDTIAVSSVSSLLDMLALDRVDMIFADEYLVKETLVNERPHLQGQYRFIEALSRDHPFFLAVSKDTPNAANIIESFDEAYHALEARGEIEEVLKQYGMYEAAPSSSSLTVGVPDINGIKQVIQYLSSHDTPFSQLAIDWRVMDETVLRKRLQGDVAVNQTNYDLVMLGNYDVPIWAKKGQLAAFADVPESYDIDDVIGAALTANTYEETLYALPFVAETTLTYYRKDLLLNAGLNIQSPLTYEQLYAMVKQLHQPEKEVYGIGLRSRVGWGQNMALLSVMVNTYGGQWVNQQMQPQINTREWHKAVSTYIDLLGNFGPPNHQDLGWQENQALFAEGKLAFFVDASSLGGSILNPKTSSVAKNVGVTQAPIGTVKRGSQWFWSWNFAVPASSERKQAAQQLALWLTSKALNDALRENYGLYAVLPGTRHSTYDESYQRAIPSASYEYSALRALSHTDTSASAIGKQFVPIAEFTAIGHLVGVQVNMALTKQVSVSEALKTAQYQTTSVMRRAGYIQ